MESCRLILTDKTWRLEDAFFGCNKFMLSKAPSWTWSCKPSGVFDEHLIMPCFVQLSKLQQVTLEKCRTMLCKLLTTWLLKMMSLPGARKMRKLGSLKDNVWLSFSIQLDVLASFFWEQGRCTTRGTAWFIAKNWGTRVRFHGRISWFLSWWFDFDFSVMWSMPVPLATSHTNEPLPDQMMIFSPSSSNTVQHALLVPLVFCSWLKVFRL